MSADKTSPPPDVTPAGKKRLNKFCTRCLERKHVHDFSHTKAACASCPSATAEERAAKNEEREERAAKKSKTTATQQAINAASTPATCIRGPSSGALQNIDTNAAVNDRGKKRSMQMRDESSGIICRPPGTAEAMPRLALDCDAVDVNEAGFVLTEVLCGSRDFGYHRIRETTNRLAELAGRIVPEDFDYDLLALDFSSEIGLFCKAQVQTSAGIFLELLRIHIFAAPVALIIRNLLAATDNDFDDLDFDADLGSIEIEQLRDLDSSAHIPYLPNTADSTAPVQSGSLQEWRRSCCNRSDCITQHEVMFKILHLRDPLKISMSCNFATVRATHASWRYVMYRLSARALGYSTRQQLPDCFVKMITKRFSDPANKYVIIL